MTRLLPRLLLLAVIALPGACSMLDRESGSPPPQEAPAGEPLRAQPLLGDAQRAQIEEHMLAQLLGAAPLYARDAVNGYVGLVGHWLLQQEQDPRYAWRFVVLDDPAIFLAGLPHGAVVVSSGLLADLSNEAELAAALAMGIGQVQAAAYLGQADAAKLASMEPEAAARRLLGLGPSSRAVLEADFEALYRVVQAGYDPWALAALLQRWMSLPPGRFSDAVFTSPDLDTRFEKLRWPLHDEFLHAGGAEIAARFEGRMR